MIPENMLMAKQMLVKLRLSKLEIVLMHYTGQGVLEKILSSVVVAKLVNRCYLMSFSKTRSIAFLEQVILSYQ